MDLFLLISDNTVEDSTQVALKKFARADFLLYQNKKTEALELLKTAIEVAQKIEDFHALIVLYEIANQQFYGFSKTLHKTVG